MYERTIVKILDTPSGEEYAAKLNQYNINANIGKGVLMMIIGGVTPVKFMVGAGVAEIAYTFATNDGKDWNKYFAKGDKITVENIFNATVGLGITRASINEKSSVLVECDFGNKNIVPIYLP